MKLLVQWTARDPTDWIEIDSREWPVQPKRPVPQAGALGARDNTPGHPYRLNVQGVEFTGDHYAVETLPNGDCRVFCWNDDPGDYPPGWRSGSA